MMWNGYFFISPKQFGLAQQNNQSQPQQHPAPKPVIPKSEPADPQQNLNKDSSEQSDPNQTQQSQKQPPVVGSFPVPSHPQLQQSGAVVSKAKAFHIDSNQIQLKFQ